MRFAWDESKNRLNLSKHDVRFETAALAFDDPYAITVRDEFSHEELRWITVGAIGPGAIHTKGGSMRKLTKEQRRDIAAIAAKKDEDIDFSDAPPVLDWSGAEIGKFYRPAKKPVTIRLDADVIEWLKAAGPGYQTKANWLLRRAMLHSKKESAPSNTRKQQKRRA